MAVERARAGVIGLGQMGGGIARNLAGNGMLAAVCDVDAARAEGFDAPALEGQAMVAACDVILLAVPGTAEVAAALEDCDGGGIIAVDLTTSAPERSRALADDLCARGFRYVDAAMTGGAAGADDGTLILMAGGSEADMAACAPVFEAIAAKVFHLGPVGSGHAMKLVHNLILHSAFMATCEGLRLAERAGLDVGAAVEVLNAGNARSFVTETRFPRDILSGTMAARSTVSNLAKDLRLAVGFARDLDGPAPYAQLTSALLDEAGQPGADFSYLFPMFEDLARQLEAGR